MRIVNKTKFIRTATILIMLILLIIILTSRRINNSKKEIELKEANSINVTKASKESSQTEQENIIDLNHL